MSIVKRKKKKTEKKDMEIYVRFLDSGSIEP